MSENQNVKLTHTRMKKINFYIALGVCALAVSAAGWSTYKSVKELTTPPRETVSFKKGKRSLGKTSQNKNEERSVATETNNVIKPEDIKENILAVSSTAVDAILISPLENSEVIKEFSEEPVFSETLCDWRVHEAIDLKGEFGTKILAVTNGIVEQIFDDSSYGKTIVIKHKIGEDEFFAYYSGFESITVKQGDEIKSGHEIGTLGEVPNEISQPPHLHFSLKRGEKFINPSEKLPI